MRACPAASVLQALASGERATPAVRRHVARCARCGDQLTQMRANDQFLARAGEDLAAALDAAVDAGPAPIGPPRRPRPEVPGYRIVDEIGRGGQGVVFRAIQTDTKRPAAVKMLLAGAFASARQCYRFERETELAAGLRHPHIVTIFGSGVAADGGRYVAMELVDGVPLDRYVEDAFGPADAPARGRVDAVTRLVLQVARGVGHAHVAGVIHRDLKPSNILVDRHGMARVLDFGLARLASEASGPVTVTQEFAGTAAYAAPERLNGQSERADARGDVNSLGMVFYRVLTGHGPYPCEGSLASVARHAASTAPTPPSRYVPRLPADIETIVLRCLAKEPERRYATASALAEDIEDALAGNPISARRDSALYVLRKLVLRNRAASAAIVAVGLTVFLAAVGFALLAADLDRSRREVEAALSDSTVQRARMMARGGDAERAEALLWGEALRSGLACGDALCFAGSPEALRSAWSLAEFYAQVPRVMRARLPAPGNAVGFEPDARTVWTVDDRGSKSVWSLDGRLVSRTPAVAAAGSTAVASANGRFALTYTDGVLTAWDLDSGRAIGTHQPTAMVVASAAAIDNSGSTVVIMNEPGRGAISIRDARTGETLESFDDAGWFFTTQHEPSGTLAVLLGTRGTPRRIIVRRGPRWNASTNIPLPGEIHEDANQGVRCSTLSPDGMWIAAAVSSTLFLVDVTSGSAMHPSRDLMSQEVERIRFDSLAPSLVVIDRDGRLMGLTIPDLVQTSVIETGRRASAVAIAGEPALVAITHPDRSLAVYEPVGRRWLNRIESTAVSHASIARGPGGALAWGDDLGEVHVRDAAAPFAVASFQAHQGVITSVAFSPQGEIVSAGFDGAVRVHQPDGTLVRTVAEALPRCWGATFSPDGRTIAVGAEDGAVRIWSNEPGAAARILSWGAARVPMVRFSPDGASLLCATVSIHEEAVVLDLATGLVRHRLGGHGTFTRAVAWSPDGSLAVTSGDDRTLRVWDASSGRLVRSIAGLPWGPYDLAFHPEGRVLFAVGPGGAVVVIDPHAGVELAQLAVHNRPVFSIVPSADGTTLFTSGEDPWIGIIDLDHLRRAIRGNEGYWRSAPTPPR
jgi:WD40 repeat protein